MSRKIGIRTDVEPESFESGMYLTIDGKSTHRLFTIGLLEDATRCHDVDIIENIIKLLRYSIKELKITNSEFEELTKLLKER